MVINARLYKDRMYFQLSYRPICYSNSLPHFRKFVKCGGDVRHG